MNAVALTEEGRGEGGRARESDIKKITKEGKSNQRGTGRERVGGVVKRTRATQRRELVGGRWRKSVK